MGVKIVFLFMSQSSAPAGSIVNWDPDFDCSDYYHQQFIAEGYFQMLQRLVDDGTISDLKIFYESNKGPGIAHWVTGSNVRCEVIPEIRFVDKYIEEDTIIWVRGGFKHWHDWLLKYKNKNWLMLYAANTGRQKWKWWDVIFDDIRLSSGVDKHERYYFPFIKPIDNSFFSPIESIKKKYDVCIGASHIHDKKGQWRVVKVLKEHEKTVGPIKAVMPGAIRRGAYTNEMLEEIKPLNINFIGRHVNRGELVEIFNESKIAMFLGTHGQNDRGPLEALSCGTPVIIGSPEYHTEMFRNFSYSLCLNSSELDYYSMIASVLGYMLISMDLKVGARTYISNKFKECLGIDLATDRFRKLIEIASEGKPTINKKIRMKEALLCK